MSRDDSAAMTKEQARELWDDYCEAASPCGSNDSDIELFDIDGMNEAAHALYAALLKQLGEPTP